MEKNHSNNAGLSKFLNQTRINKPKIVETESSSNVISKPSTMNGNKVDNNNKQVVLNDNITKKSDEADKAAGVATKGRRGRPKNATNKSSTKTAIVPCTSINKYFKAGKSDQHVLKVCIRFQFISRLIN